MKKKLFLYLSKSDHPENIAIASTMAWLCKSKDYIFDNYYESYHQGIHFTGGDSRNLDTGELSGGTVVGDRHFEEFYFLLHNFDVTIISYEDSIFSSTLINFNVPVIELSGHINDLYQKIFRLFDSPLPSDIVLIGSDYGKALSGLEAYLYPEIYYRKAIGVIDTIKNDELANLYQSGSKIFCFYADKDVITRLQKTGYSIEIIDQLKEKDDYLSVTTRIVKRWKEKAKGVILGDPMLVAYWLPKACEEDLFSIYSIPQEKIVSSLGDFISSKRNVVYGRQYNDKDFFELSRLNQCFQVIDPCRPPFQSVKHVEYNWNKNQKAGGFYNPEFTDAELKQFAREGKILISLMFWSGMVREIANFYNLMDLFAMTRLKCGLVLTAQSYEYMMHSPLELITVPWEQGGVYPLVEPVLGSCGIGVGIESYIDKNRLRETIDASLSRIALKVKNKCFMPRGWWATMDTDLVRLSRLEGPKPIRFLKYSPFIQIRFNAKEKKYEENSGPSEENSKWLPIQHLTEKLKEAIRHAGLMKYFEPYRPYEFYRAGPIKKDLIEAIKTTGLKYMFTKSGFNENPEAKYIDDDFIAMNYTSGQWDGWTPFETVNDVSDLKKTENLLLNRKNPGWIVSTIDSCLWTFSGEFWKKGSKLFEIARFCSEGGKSGRLINVKPFTVARYARIITENN